MILCVSTLNLSNKYINCILKLISSLEITILVGDNSGISLLFPVARSESEKYILWQTSVRQSSIVKNLCNVINFVLFFMQRFTLLTKKVLLTCYGQCAEQTELAIYLSSSKTMVQA